MNWQDRTRQSITFTSPAGLTFEAGWAGDDMSFEKQAGQFSYPMVNGSDVQDLGRTAYQYPLTVLFEGPDNDKDARAFVKAFDDRGVWTVVHPVDGTLKLQPIGTVTRKIQPISSGNITSVSATWVIPLSEEGKTYSSASVSAEIDDLVDTINSLTLDSTAAAVDISLESFKTSFLNTLNASLSKLKQKLKTLSSPIEAAITEINSASITAKSDVASVAGAIQEILQYPSLFGESVVSQVTSLVELGESILDSLPSSDSDISTSAKNGIVATELVASSIIGALAEAAVSQTPDTRGAALALMDSIADFIDETLSAFDTQGENAQSNALADQYFGMANGPEIRFLKAKLTTYFLSLVGDLKAEHRIVLERPRSPLEIAITEYGATAATVDEYYDLLLRTNKLSGLDILLLPAGSEVALYA
jgi:prophage DNA circulation protein